MTKKDKKKKDKAEKTGSPGRHAFAPGHLHSEITRASRSMRTFLSNSLSASGLYAGQDGVIMALADSDGLTAGAIAQKLGVKPPTMTRTLARMEAQGFLERQTPDGDGRVTRAVLTEAGRRHVSAIQYAVKATEASAFEGLTEKEIRQFAKVLRKINRNMGSEGADDAEYGD